ncbi:MAG: TraX protein [Blautia sp.]|nr:TraX protein [Blautia sp.]
MNAKNNVSLPESVFPAQMQILSGSALKLIAILTMLIDHTGVIILSKIPAGSEPLFTLFGKDYTLYMLSRNIGRIAFPIFCFLLLEGIKYTRSRIKYALNLLLFAFVSEIPWDIWHFNGFSFDKQNVFFTLFLGMCAICAIEYFQDNQGFQLLAMLLFLFLAKKCNADYGWKGYVFILIMYFLKERRVAQAFLGSCWLAYEWRACFAFIPINMYNGKRGFIRGKPGKYLFYAFYPLHICVLLWIRKYFLHM